MPWILGNTGNDWWSQALCKMPENFRHYVKCLITWIACNIYMYICIYVCKVLIDDIPNCIILLVEDEGTTCACIVATLSEH